MTTEKSSESDNFVLLGWDPRQILWLMARVRTRVLNFVGRLIPRSLIDFLVNNSKFKDPRYARINGRWIKIDNTKELVGQLEELQQEASR